MVGVSKYSGNPLQAARLHAARIAAGFASATDAARKFGWSEPRYRSNEGAVRAISPAGARIYAKAFGISAAWLLGGGDPHRNAPKVDPLRLQQLKLRVQAQARLVTSPQDLPAGRLRLARRLAGYRSAAAAARELGIHPSTLNAQERGLSAVDRQSALTLASMFGCEPGWLITGRLPSGYPKAIELELSSLLEDHNLSERQAATRLPHFSPPRTEPAHGPALSPISIATLESLNAIPEYDSATFARDVMRTGPHAREPVRTWSMPDGFIHAVLTADSSACAIVAFSDRRTARNWGLDEGDRLIIDTSARTVLSAVYAIADGQSVVLLDARNSTLRAELSQRVQNSASVLLGKVVGVVAAFPMGRAR